MCNKGDCLEYYFCFILKKLKDTEVFWSFPTQIKTKFEFTLYLSEVQRSLFSFTVTKDLFERSTDF